MEFKLFPLGTYLWTVYYYAEGRIKKCPVVPGTSYLLAYFETQ